MEQSWDSGFGWISPCRLFPLRPRRGRRGPHARARGLPFCPSPLLALISQFLTHGICVHLGFHSGLFLLKSAAVAVRMIRRPVEGSGTLGIFGVASPSAGVSPFSRYCCRVSKTTAPENGVNGFSESAGINRLGIENERVLQGTTCHRLWPQTLRWER